MYNKYTVRKRGIGPDALRRFGKGKHRKLAVPKDQVTAHKENGPVEQRQFAESEVWQSSSGKDQH